jgi:hypothetical protein
MHLHIFGIRRAKTESDVAIRMDLGRSEWLRDSSRKGDDCGHEKKRIQAHKAYDKYGGFEVEESSKFESNARTLTGRGNLRMLSAWRTRLGNFSALRRGVNLTAVALAWWWMAVRLDWN